MDSLFRGNDALLSVTLAEAGVYMKLHNSWIPSFEGMTEGIDSRLRGNDKKETRE